MLMIGYHGDKTNKHVYNTGHFISDHHISPNIPGDYDHDDICMNCNIFSVVESKFVHLRRRPQIPHAQHKEGIS